MSKNWIGHYKSSIENPKFFLSPNGHESLTQELEANLLALKVDPKYPCRFPARAHFLYKTYKLLEIKCTQVENWKSDLKTEALSLVFVTQYHSNPASTFGHSYLLLRNSKIPIHLNYTISNAAQIPENVSTFDYIFKGLLGGFPAKYSIEPQYIKVQEYNYIENRDLWIYDLNFNKEQIDQFLNHIWELSQFDETYVFANQNCSYSIYNALAAIHPDLSQLNSRALYVLPVSTIRNIKDLSKNETFMPSHRRKLQNSIDHLNEKEVREFQNFLAYTEALHSPRTIDTAIFYYDFLKIKNEGTLSQDQNQTFNNLLIQRSKMEGTSTPFPSDLKPDSPLLSLPSWRLGYARNKNINYIQLSPFYHELLDPDASYLSFSEMIMLNMQYDLDKGSIDTIETLSFSNYIATLFFDPQLSWQMKLGFRKGRPQSESWNYTGELLIGKSYSISASHLWYLLIGYERTFEMSQGAALKSGLLFKFDHLKIQLEAVRNRFNSSDQPFIYEAKINMSLGKSSILSLSNQWRHDTTSQISLGYYF